MSGRSQTAHDPIFGCELVLHPVDKDGYGLVGRQRTHIKAWVDANGPVPDGKVLDHACRRRNCRALIHLEPVTQSENELRKSWKYRARIARCPSGHDLSTHGMVTPEGGRVCRACFVSSTRGQAT